MVAEIEDRLHELKIELGTWQAVADRLSAQAGESISRAAVWKTAMGRTRSPRVLQALGVRPADVARTANLVTAERARTLDRLLAQDGMNLDELCNGLVDGRLAVVRRVQRRDAW
jgi:hypothetical protein